MLAVQQAGQRIVLGIAPQLLEPHRLLVEHAAHLPGQRIHRPNHTAELPRTRLLDGDESARTDRFGLIDHLPSGR